MGHPALVIGDTLNEWIGRAVAWCVLALVLAAFAVVVLRYGFGIGAVALQETVTWLHAIVFMVGAAYTLRHDAHVRVDVFYRGMAPRHRALVDLLGSLFLLMPICALILWKGWGYAATSWALGEGSRETGGLSHLWLLKSLIPLTAALLLLQGASLALHSLRAILGRVTPPEPHEPEELP